MIPSDGSPPRRRARIAGPTRVADDHDRRPGGRATRSVAADVRADDRHDADQPDQQAEPAVRSEPVGPPVTQGEHGPDEGHAGDEEPGQRARQLLLRGAEQHPRDRDLDRGERRRATASGRASAGRSTRRSAIGRRIAGGDRRPGEDQHGRRDLRDRDPDEQVRDAPDDRHQGEQDDPAPGHRARRAGGGHPGSVAEAAGARRGASGRLRLAVSASRTGSGRPSPRPSGPPARTAGRRPTAPTSAGSRAGSRRRSPSTASNVWSAATAADEQPAERRRAEPGTRSRRGRGTSRRAPGRTAAGTRARARAAVRGEAPSGSTARARPGRNSRVPKAAETPRFSPTRTASQGRSRAKAIARTIAETPAPNRWPRGSMLAGWGREDGHAETSGAGTGGGGVAGHAGRRPGPGRARTCSEGAEVRRPDALPGPALAGYRSNSVPRSRGSGRSSCADHTGTSARGKGRDGCVTGSTPPSRRRAASRCRPLAGRAAGASRSRRRPG